MTDAVKTEFHFGQRVRITHRLDRRTEGRVVIRNGTTTRPQWKIWKPVQFGRRKEGLVIGIRMLANGEVSYEWDAGTLWLAEAAERFTAYLVAYDFRRKPVYVLPEHMEVVDTST